MHALLLLAAWTLSGGASPASPFAASPSLAPSPPERSLAVPGAGAPVARSPRLQDPHDGEDPAGDDTGPLGPPTRIRGRLVDPDGAPVEGVELRLTAGRTIPSLVERFGLPRDWPAPEPVRTDAEGRFELRLAPPRARRLELDVEDPRFAPVHWSWFGHWTPTELDLGDAVVAAPAIVRGHVLSPTGELLTERVRVSLRADGPAHQAWAYGPRRDWSVRADVDGDTGEFRAESVPAGTVEVTVQDLATGRSLQESVELAPGQELARSWVLEDGGEARQLRVHVLPTTTGIPDLAPGTVVALSEAGVRTEFPQPRRPGMPWVLEGLEPGFYAIEVEDPRYVPWRREGLPPGASVQAVLTGSSGLALTLTGPAGAPVEHCTVRLSPTGETPRIGRPLVLCAEGVPWPADGRFGGLVAGDYELELDPGDGAATHVPVLGLAPGEVRALTVRLGAPARLSGRVVDASGAPLAGVEVQRTRGSVQGHDDPLGGVQAGYDTVDGEPVPFRIPPRDEAVRTDADGRFVFEDLSAGPQALRAIFGTWVRVDQVVEVTGDGTTECVLTRPAIGAVDVAVDVPDDVDPARVQVRVEPEDPVGLLAGDVRMRAAMGGPPRERAPGRVEGLPVGPTRVEVLLLPSDDGAPSPGEDPRGGDPRRGVRRTRGAVVHEHVVEVAADRTTEVHVDLRERFPATGALQATFDGAPAEGARPVLVRRGAGEPSHVYGTPLDRGGAGTFAAVPPGTYDLRVDHRGRGWTWTAPDPVVVEARTPFELRLEVPLVARRLLLVDAAGAPLANRTVQWRPATLPARGNGTTDATGHLDLRLPPGDYTLAVFPEGYDPNTRGRGPRPDPTEVPLTWSAGEGALRVPVGG